MADLIDRAKVLAIFDKLDDGSRAAEQARQAIANLTTVSVKRYDLQQAESHMGSAYMQEDDYGDWVRYSDLAAQNGEKP